MHHDAIHIHLYVELVSSRLVYLRFVYSYIEGLLSLSIFLRLHPPLLFCPLRFESLLLHLWEMKNVTDSCEITATSPPRPFFWWEAFIGRDQGLG
jgi:hypothetical protein